MKNLALIFPLLFAVVGMAMALKAAALRTWLIGVYDNPRITRHLNMPGYLLSMRLVGAFWVVFASVILVSAVAHQISN